MSLGPERARRWHAGKIAPTAPRSFFHWLPMLNRRFFPTSPHRFVLESACRNEYRDTPRSRIRTLPVTNEHAASQKVPKLDVGEGVETEGLRISQQSCNGSSVSP